MQTSITPEELADMGDVTILDVRKKPAYDEDTVVIAGGLARPGDDRRLGPLIGPRPEHLQG